ncbi:hypothetical protein OG871_27765 [Kitasatospora sp. NBC_00374]
MLRWDGVQRLPETVVADYAAAQRLLHGIDGDSVVRPVLAPNLRSRSQFRDGLAGSAGIDLRGAA